MCYWWLVHSTPERPPVRIQTRSNQFCLLICHLTLNLSPLVIVLYSYRSLPAEYTALESKQAIPLNTHHTYISPYIRNSWTFSLKRYIPWLRFWCRVNTPLVQNILEFKPAWALLYIVKLIKTLNIASHLKIIWFQQTSPLTWINKRSYGVVCRGFDRLSQQALEVN